MPDQTLDSIYVQIAELFDRANYEQAFELAGLGARRYPLNRASFDYLKICAATQLGDFRLACEILRSAFDAGSWYAEHVLRSSPALKSIQGDREFERLVRASAERHASVQRSSVAPSPLILDPGPPATHLGILFTLHGNGSTAREEAHFWQPAVAQGWLLAMPGSSQAHWPGCQIWNDYARARRDVLAGWRQVADAAVMPGCRVVAAGFSLGGQTALRMALDGSLDADGFVGLAPYLPDLAGWEKLIRQRRRRDLRCAIMAGRHDPNLQNLQELVRLLREDQATCQLLIVGSGDNRYPAAFGEALLQCLDFVGQTV